MSPSNLSIREAILFASRTMDADGDSTSPLEPLELALSPSPLFFHSPSGILSHYQHYLSHNVALPHPSETDHHYVARAYHPYRSWPRVYDHLGIKGSAQEAFRQTVLDIKDASLAARFAPHSIKTADFAPDDASWELFDELVEDWLMKWGAVMWSDRRGTMTAMREAWVVESERGGEIQIGNGDGTFKGVPDPDEEDEDERVREAWPVDCESESEEQRGAADGAFEGVADLGEEVDECTPETTKKSGLWWNEKEDREQIQLAIRELFKYLGNNAYDGRKVREVPLPTRKILTNMFEKSIRSHRSRGLQPSRKKVKPCIRQYIEEHGLSLTKSAAASCLKRPLRAEDFQSWHDGYRNHDMVEKQLEERREEKKAKYRRVSLGGGERDGDVKEMEKRYPYGFGLGILDALRRGEYPAGDRSVIGNSGIENGWNSDVENGEARLDYESQWP
jgi:hypothetical protein